MDLAARARGDDDRARRRRRRALLPARARAVRARPDGVRRRGGRADRRRRVRRASATAYEGHAAGASPARRLVGAQRAGDDARRRRVPAARSGSATRCASWSAGSTLRAAGSTCYPVRRGLMAKKGKRKAAPGDIATNRQASFRYNLLERFEAASCSPAPRSSRCATARRSSRTATRRSDDGEVWLHNVHIPPYGPATRENHEPERAAQAAAAPARDRPPDRPDRRARPHAGADADLLLGPRTPRSRSRSRAARTRFDKRESIREREMAREAERAIRDYQR